MVGDPARIDSESGGGASKALLSTKKIAVAMCISFALRRDLSGIKGFAVPRHKLYFSPARVC